MKILIADKLDAASLAAAAERGHQVLDRSGITAEDLAREIADVDALVVRSRSKVTAELLQRADRLKVVGRAGTGVDNIDVAAATRRGILVMNTPGANSNSAAEHSLALILAASRRISPAHASVLAGRWEPGAFTGTEVHGKTLGIIGLGRIGLLLAAKAKGLGMKVIAYDPVTSAEVASRQGVELLPLAIVLGSADVVSLHVPLVESTRHIIDAKALRSMKRNAILVNCARGGLVDESALAEAIAGGTIAAAALDVFEKEPPLESPLLGLPQVLMTPHLGASTVEAQARVAREILDQIADHLDNGSMRGAVNGLPLDESTREQSLPLVDLAVRQGRILAALRGEGTKVVARYFGAAAARNARALSSYFLCGFLSQFTDEEVSPLNAVDVAKRRGIELEEILRDEHRSFQVLLNYAIEGGVGADLSEISGTTFGKSGLRIVQVGRHDVDAIPEGRMLVITNRDVPGVLGGVASALGAAKVNIGNMSLGRERTRGEAMAILNLDAPPPASVMAQIRQIPGVQAVVLVDADGLRKGELR